MKTKIPFYVSQVLGLLFLAAWSALPEKDMCLAASWVIIYCHFQQLKYNKGI